MKLHAYNASKLQGYMSPNVDIRNHTNNTCISQIKNETPAAGLELIKCWGRWCPLGLPGHILMLYDHCQSGISFKFQVTESWEYTTNI